jgi:hypothetical protein
MPNNNKIINQVFNYLLIIFIFINLFVVISNANESEEKTCLMDSICKNKLNGVIRNSPCHRIHAPYDNVTDDDFYDLLWNNCPHFFDDKGLYKRIVYFMCRVLNLFSIKLVS